MSIDKIKTPKGMVIKTSNGTCRLVWNDGFGAEWSERFTEAQKWLDSEVVRLCAPKVPMQTGMLMMSSKLGTKPGDGEVIYLGPYARYQYYGKVMVGSAPKRVIDKDLMYQHAPQRGAFWFERMKTDYKAYLIEGARRRAGGKA